MEAMEVKLELSYDARDNLFLQLLYEGYECCYFCYLDDKEKFDSDPVRYKRLVDEIELYEKTLESYEHLADHYSRLGEGAKKLGEIRDRFDYKYKIAKGMSNENS